MSGAATTTRSKLSVKTAAPATRGGVQTSDQGRPASRCDRLLSRRRGSRASGPACAEQRAGQSTRRARILPPRPSLRARAGEAPGLARAPAESRDPVVQSARRKPAICPVRTLHSQRVAPSGQSPSLATHAGRGNRTSDSAVVCTTGQRLISNNADVQVCTSAAIPALAPLSSTQARPSTAPLLSRVVNDKRDEGAPAIAFCRSQPAPIRCSVDQLHAPH